MKKFNMWIDGQSEKTIIEAKDGNEALDKFCQKMGFIDHADYCQENNLDESNINMSEITEY